MPSQPPQPQPELPDSTLSLGFVNPVDLEDVGSAQLIYLDNGRIQLTVTKDIPAGAVAILPVTAPVATPEPPPAQPKFSSFDHP